MGVANQADLPEVIFETEGTLPALGLLVFDGCGSIQHLPLQLASQDPHHSTHHQPPFSQGLQGLPCQQGELLLLGHGHEWLPPLLVRAKQLITDVVQCGALVAIILPLQLLCKGIQIQVLKLLWSLQDLLYGCTGIGFISCLEEEEGQEEEEEGQEEEEEGQ